MGKKKAKLTQQLLPIIKSPPVSRSPCDGCKIPHDQTVLFCNQCGCYLCFECASNPNCKVCGVKTDIDSIRKFFDTYCPSCKKLQVSQYSKPCKICKSDIDFRTKLLEKEALIKQLVLKTSNMLDMTCVICLDKKRSFLAEPCNHLCYCLDCATKLINTTTKECSICKQKVNRMIRVFY